MSKEITLTSGNFTEEVLNSNKPVLVDFWASWCGPCRMLAPIIEEIAEEQDSIKVCKLNVDEENGLAGTYEVMSIPTLILFKDGKPVKKSVGMKSKQAVLSFVGI